MSSTRLSTKLRTIDCIGCDEQLVSFSDRSVTFNGPMPMEFFTDFASEQVFMTCPHCGTPVALEREIIRIH